MMKKPELLSDEQLVDLCKLAMHQIDESLKLPPRHVKEEVDHIERTVVKLRDALIDRVRAAGEPKELTPDRQQLRRINAALSPIIGIEYPVSVLKKSDLTQARDELEDMATIWAAKQKAAASQ